MINKQTLADNSAPYLTDQNWFNLAAYSQVFCPDLEVFSSFKAPHGGGLS